MAFETGTEIVKVRAPDGTELNFEVSRLGGERKVGRPGFQQDRQDH
jgi:hypothetical protein